MEISNKFDSLENFMYIIYIMIAEGIDGSINGYYKNKLIVSRPLGGIRSVENYIKDADAAVLEGLRTGWNIKRLIKLNLNHVKLWRYNDLKKTPREDDKDCLLLSLLMLIKLKVIDIDGDREGLLIMPIRKTRSLCR